MDYLLWMMITAIIGARIYYVVFSWDAYKDNIPEIFNLRHGGLGIVGGVTMAIIVLLIFAKVRKQSALLMLDTMTMGLLLGQIMGRWGNFVNREAFGGYTNGPVSYTHLDVYKRQEQELKKLGLKVKKAYANSDTVKEGYVIKQSPKGGSIVNTGFAVTITTVSYTHLPL